MIKKISILFFIVLLFCLIIIFLSHDIKIYSNLGIIDIKTTNKTKFIVSLKKHHPYFWFCIKIPNTELNKKEKSNIVLNISILENDLVIFSEKMVKLESSYYTHIFYFEKKFDELLLNTLKPKKKYTILIDIISPDRLYTNGNNAELILTYNTKIRNFLYFW